MAWSDLVVQEGKESAREIDSVGVDKSHKSPVM